MRLLHVTAGAANMYCGSCMRDNALASELKRMGHDVVLMPIYTPTLTDEANVSEDRVFFGGISVYLQQKSAFFRHTPGFVDRLLFDNSWALRAATQKSIGVDPRFLGEMTVAMLQGIRGPIGKEFRKLVRWVRSEPKFDVISIPFTLLISLAEPLKRAGKTKVVCTLQGEDLFLDGLMEPYKSESMERIRSMIPHVDRFIAVSSYYANFMAQYLSIPREKIRTAPIGISSNGFEAKPKPARDLCKIGFFARMDPAKGFHHLGEAYRKLRDHTDLPPLRLEAAGYMLKEHEEYFNKEHALLRAAGFGGEFTYHGAVSRERKTEFLQDMDILCVPTQYVEPKGLFVLEALANGTPVVLPAHGAFPEILSRTGGGILYPPGDTNALVETLHTMICDKERRDLMAAEGSANVRTYYSAEAMAAAHLEIYNG